MIGKRIYIQGFTRKIRHTGLLVSWWTEMTLFWCSRLQGGHSGVQTHACISTHAHTRQPAGATFLQRPLSGISCHSYKSSQGNWTCLPADRKPQATAMLPEHSSSALSTECR